MKINLLVELDYDADTMHGTDLEAIQWFREVVLNGTKGELILHSNEIGDEVGTINVLRVYE